MPVRLLRTVVDTARNTHRRMFIGDRFGVSPLLCRVSVSLPCLRSVPLARVLLCSPVPYRTCQRHRRGARVPPYAFPPLFPGKRAAAAFATSLLGKEPRGHCPPFLARPLYRFTQGRGQ
eukprot:3751114-Prymnesium_polylepis.1